MDLSNILSVVLGLGGALIAIVGFLIKFGSRLAKAQQALDEVVQLKQELEALKSKSVSAVDVEHMKKCRETSKEELAERLRSAKVDIESKVMLLNNAFSSTINQWKDLEDQITELIKSNSISETEIANIEKHVESIDKIVGDLRERVARIEGSQHKRN